MKNKVLISLICCLGLANANDNADSINRDRYGVSQDEAYGSHEVINTQRRTKQDDVQDNTYAVIYNHLQSYEQSKVKSGSGSALPIVLHDFYADKLQVQAELAAQQQAALEAKYEPKYVFTDGYCVLQNEVKIGRIAGYADLNCDLSVNGHATLKVALTPDFYSRALIATPLYLNLNGKRYTIIAGAVQNGIRTSINVATEVDNYLVSAILADTAVGTASIMTQYAQEYIDERKAYRESKNNKTKTSTQTTSGGNVIITQEDDGEDLPPKMGDYLGGALVEITGKLIESIGNAYLQTREYSFKIDAKTVMFADLQIDINQEGIKGVGYEPENLIVQQPSVNFTDGDPTMGLDYPNANIGELPDTGTKVNPENGGAINIQGQGVAPSAPATKAPTRQMEQSAARSRTTNTNRVRPTINTGPSVRPNRRNNDTRVIDTRTNY